MRVVVQRVINASVEVDGQICGSIKKGLLVFIGVGDGDSENDCKRLADKIINLRIFSDENDKINLMQEKPDEIFSNWCCPPFYLYKKDVFFTFCDII